jgi:CO/xanthine dehydrogenase Mo-binding subunit
MSGISKSIPKQDTAGKTSGKALYISDIKIDGMLHAKTLRSAKTRAIIKDIIIPELPEGYYIVDHNDIPGENYVKIIFDDMPVFAEKTVDYYGEPILLVVGEDKQVVQDLVNSIEVNYEELEPHYKYSKSVIHYEYEKGNTETAFANAVRTINGEYTTGYQEHIYLEPQGIVSIYEPGKITILGSMQCPYYIKNAVMQVLDVGENGVRVQQSTTGGAFGGKEEFPSLMACQVAVAAAKLKKPVSLIYDRTEDIEVSTKRHPALIKFTAAINPDYKVDAIRAHVSLDSGAYIGLSGVVLQRAMIAASGVYTIDNLSVSGDVYETNSVPNGAFRGFGAPQMFFAIEMFMEHIAKELNYDPFEFKLGYIAKKGDETSTGGKFRDPIILKDMIHKIWEVSEYQRKKTEFSQPGDNRGIGMSLFLHGCGFTGSGEQKHIKAVVRLKKNEDDTVTILAANTDMGQGAATTLRKIAAGVLDIPVERVIYNKPNTDLVPDSGPTVASRTVMIVGGLIARAARALKEKWEDGAEMVVEEKYRQPEFIVWDEDKMHGDAYPAYSWGVVVCEVEVDPVTCEVTLRDVWSAYDVGKAIDEMIVLGQIEGGLLQGIGYGMMEVMECREGKIQQRNVTDYIIPTAADIVNMHTYIMDNPYPLGPYGAKGAGELPLVGGAPAVAMAIENAISRKITKVPATPEYIMELVKNG